jgi:hypothetical protein
VCREFGLVNSRMQTILENGNKIISVGTERIDQIKRFRKPKVTSMRLCVIGLSNRKVTM